MAIRNYAPCVAASEIQVQYEEDICTLGKREIMSQAQYESMAETLYLLSHPANAAHLATSIAQHKAGKAKRRQLFKA